MSDTTSIYNLFDTVPPVTKPVYLPKGGTVIHFKWEDDKRCDDWRADGYRWRHGGALKNKKCDEGFISKTYFQVSLYAHISTII
jgi:hypothetical protein